MSEAFAMTMHLLPCPCGTPQDKLQSGWFSPPMTFYAHCPDCGVWVTCETVAATQRKWNARLLEIIPLGAA